MNLLEDVCRVQRAYTKKTFYKISSKVCRDTRDEQKEREQNAFFEKARNDKNCIDRMYRGRQQYFIVQPGTHIRPGANATMRAIAESPRDREKER